MIFFLQTRPRRRPSPMGAPSGQNGTSSLNGKVPPFPALGRGSMRLMRF
jgi:hypothetical protein